MIRIPAQSIIYLKSCEPRIETVLLYPALKKPSLFPLLAFR